MARIAPSLEMGKTLPWTEFLKRIEDKFQEEHK